jgi:hypothetical protein
VNREQLLNRLDTAWAAFQASYTGLSSAQLAEPGVVEHWSVKDLIAHVSWWEEEALQHLPLVLAGGRPPRYSVRYGGIDAFNALKCEQARALSLADVLSQFEATHRRLVAYCRPCPKTNSPEKPGSAVDCVLTPTATTRSTQSRFGNGGSVGEIENYRLSAIGYRRLAVSTTHDSRLTTHDSAINFSNAIGSSRTRMPVAW